MDNAVQAIRMGFSMFIFALALTTAMYIFSICGNTAQAIVYYTDESNYYDNISLKGSDPQVKTREVGFDTVITSLYRYYKENFSVRLIDYTNGRTSGVTIQVFDITTENKVALAYEKSNGNVNATNITEEERLLLNTYGQHQLPYLFGAPWNVNALEYAKQRVDLFINGSVGYINNLKVDYTYNVGSQPTADTNPANLKYYMEQADSIKIEESFVQYNYSGDTISVGEGENIETLTGNRVPDSKIEITYSFRDK